MNRRNILRFSLFGLLILSAACSALPTEEPTEGPDFTAYTLEAQTIVAQMTEIASETEIPVPGTGQPLPDTLEAALSTPVTDTPRPSDTPAPSETATPTVSPTATVTPTQTTVSTATPGAEDPRTSLGAPDWQNDFSSASNWPLYDDEHVEMTTTESAIEMTALNADGWDSWMLARPILEDFYLEVAATPEDCSGLDHYGLLARAPSSNEGYLFGLSCDGRYSLRLWDGEKFTRLEDWTNSNAILAGSGETNRLGIWAQGDQIRMYANGTLLTEVTDDTYNRGQFGLFIGASETEDFTVAFEEAAYWVLSP